MAWINSRKGHPCQFVSIVRDYLWRATGFQPACIALHRAVLPNTIMLDEGSATRVRHDHVPLHITRA
jgi:hypothetical protein